jgi:hypothetical protein
VSTPKAKAPASDRPTIHATTAKLDAQAKPEAFVYMTSANARVTFPDPFDMEWEEAEAFLEELEAIGNSAAALQKWLSEDDYAALKTERLTLRQGLNLVTMVQQHYAGVLGSQGEGKSS